MKSYKELTFENLKEATDSLRRQGIKKYEYKYNSNVVLEIDTNTAEVDIINIRYDPCRNINIYIHYLKEVKYDIILVINSNNTTVKESPIIRTDHELLNLSNIIANNKALDCAIGTFDADPRVVLGNTILDIFVSIIYQSEQEIRKFVKKFLMEATMRNLCIHVDVNGITMDNKEAIKELEEDKNGEGN